MSPGSSPMLKPSSCSKSNFHIPISDQWVFLYFWMCDCPARSSSCPQVQSPAILQSQFVILDALILKLITSFMCPHLFIIISMCWCHPCLPTSTSNPSNQCFWRPLALTEAADLILSTIWTSLALPWALPLAIAWGAADGLNQKSAKSNMTWTLTPSSALHQLHHQCFENKLNSPITVNNLDAGEYKCIPPTCHQCVLTKPLAPQRMCWSHHPCLESNLDSQQCPITPVLVSTDTSPQHVPPMPTCHSPNTWPHRGSVDITTHALKAT